MAWIRCATIGMTVAAALGSLNPVDAQTNDGKKWVATWDHFPGEYLEGQYRGGPGQLRVPVTAPALPQAHNQTCG